MGLQKVAFNFMVERGGKLAKSLLCTKPQKTTPGIIKYNALTKDCATFTQTKLPKADELLNIKQFQTESPKFIKDNFFDCEVINCVRYDRKNKLIRMNAGFEYSDLKGRYQMDKRICCYLDDNERVTQALMLDTETNNIKAVDFVNELKQNYSRPEVEALHYYKYHPDSIHARLRYGRDMYSGDFQVETTNTIRNLEAIFGNSSKLSVNKEKRIIYRALQNRLSEDEISNLQQIGKIFTDKSFCSTTTDLKVARRFANANPILEIEFPEGAQYIDMDKLFNIDREHWLEKEFLLDKNARFQVIGFDKENNIVKVKYLL